VAIDPALRLDDPIDMAFPAADEGSVAERGGRVLGCL
jgi:hypothetical protein